MELISQRMIHLCYVISLFTNDDRNALNRLGQTIKVLKLSDSIEVEEVDVMMLELTPGSSNYDLVYSRLIIYYVSR